MPQYYNLSKYSNLDNLMGVYAITDELMVGFYSLFLILVLGIWITYMRIKQNDSPTNAVVIGSFYSLMLAIALYVSQIFYSGMAKPGLYLFIPAVILVGASIVKWYNKR